MPNNIVVAHIGCLYRALLRQQDGKEEGEFVHGMARLFQVGRH
jgi:hypothetical protein